MLLFFYSLHASSFRRVYHRVNFSGSFVVDDRKLSFCTESEASDREKREFSNWDDEREFSSTVASTHLLSVPMLAQRMTIDCFLTQIAVK